MPSSTPRSVAEYLDLEQHAAARHEYRSGEVVEVGGASLAHNTIVLNLGSELRRLLEGRPERAFVSDLRVSVPASALYAYPDVVVTNGSPAIEAHPADSLLNPLAIFEVLSPSTEAYDRGKKFEAYRTLPSLEHYILVAQDRVAVDHFRRSRRRSDGRGVETWNLVARRQREQLIELEPLDLSLALDDVYAGLSF